MTAGNCMFVPRVQTALSPDYVIASTTPSPPCTSFFPATMAPAGESIRLAVLTHQQFLC